MTREVYEKLKKLAAKKDPATFAHIEDAALFMAEALNLLDAANCHITAAFDLNPEWDNMLESNVNESRAELGGCLAALNTWWADLYNEDGSQKE